MEIADSQSLASGSSAAPRIAAGATIFPLSATGIFVSCDGAAQASGGVIAADDHVLGTAARYPQSRLSVQNKHRLVHGRHRERRLPAELAGACARCEPDRLGGHRLEQRRRLRRARRWLL